jgi:hypothetical protein
MILLIQNLPLFCQFSHSEAKRALKQFGRAVCLGQNQVQIIRHLLRAKLLLSIGLLIGLAMPQMSQAALYKCQIAGKTVYQDKECPGAKDSKPYTPRNPISTMSSEALTGQPKKEVDNRPAWLKPIDPIGDCKARGGTIDKELRACIVP